LLVARFGCGLILLVEIPRHDLPRFLLASIISPESGDAMIKFIIFAIASVIIIWVSWAPLQVRDRRSHGFFRFFAWESILALILLNVEYWFTEPFSMPQFISWLLLCASLFLVVHGVHLLRVIGKPRGQFENTTALVKLGAYRFIRHPLYSSLLLLTWGVFFKHLSLLGSVLALVATAFLVATARIEEMENMNKFGEDYAAYMKTTKMFIPFVF
jgi:protein-S-isoprenylcysteine O-methyltransferase Ste14